MDKRTNERMKRQKEKKNEPQNKIIYSYPFSDLTHTSSISSTPFTPDQLSTLKRISYFRYEENEIKLNTYVTPSQQPAYMNQPLSSVG